MHSSVLICTVTVLYSEATATVHRWPGICMEEIYCTLYAENCTIHTVHCTWDTIHSTLNTVHCTVSDLLWTVHCTHIFTVYCTLYCERFTMHCSLHTAHRALHTSHFMLYTVSCPLILYNVYILCTVNCLLTLCTVPGQVVKGLGLSFQLCDDLASRAC